MTLLHLRPIALVKKEVTDSAIRRVMAAAGEDLDDLMILCRADITTRNPKKVKKYLNNFNVVEDKMSNVEERDSMRAFQSPIRGQEIMKTFDLNEGKKIGFIKHAIEEAILNGEIKNNIAEAREFMLKNKDKILVEFGEIQ